MFVLGLRGPEGVSVFVRLVLTWTVSMLLALQSTVAISTIVVLLSLGATIYAALVVLRKRKSLRFDNRFSEEHAFPSMRLNERLNFGLHTFVLLFFYVPGAAMLLLKLPELTVPETRMVTGGAFLVGHLGVAGLALQGWRRFGAGR
jgi:hypothetical protein